MTEESRIATENESDEALFATARAHMEKFSAAASLDRRLWDATVRLVETSKAMQEELARICVAVGRSKDGTGYDVDWYDLAGDVARLSVPSAIGRTFDGELTHEQRKLAYDTAKMYFNSASQYRGPDAQEQCRCAIVAALLQCSFSTVSASAPSASELNNVGDQAGPATGGSSPGDPTPTQSATRLTDIEPFRDELINLLERRERGTLDDNVFSSKIEGVLRAIRSNTPSATVPLSVALKAIDDEPELPNEPGTAAEQTIAALREADDETWLFAMRLLVKQTKEGIRERLLATADRTVKPE